MNSLNILFLQSILFSSLSPLLNLCFQSFTKFEKVSDACSMSDDSENSIKCKMESDGKKSIGSLETLKMKFSSDCNITSVDSQNMKVLCSSYENNQFSFDVDVKDRFSSLTVSYNDSDSDDSPTQSSTYYIYKKDNIAYTSSVSLDYAIEKSDDDPTIINSSVSIGGITNPFIDITPTPVQKKTYSGTIKWKDDNGNIFPLVGAKVVFIYKLSNNINSNKIEMYTDDNGSFATNIIAGSATVLNYDLYLNGQYVSVKRPDDTIKNTKAGFENHSSDYKISLIDNIADFYNDKSVIISTKSEKKEESDFGKAVQIFQALYYYSKYAHNLKNGSSIPAYTTYYPSNYNFSKLNNENSFSNVTGASYYNSGKYIVLPSENNGLVKSIPVYESWDTIGHEYGHHIGWSMGCCKGLGKGYSHSSNKDEISNLINKYELDEQEAVNDGLSLAFVESWPTYWSEIAQSSFPSTIIKNYANKYISDKKYEAYNSSSSNYYSLNFNESSGYVGEINERSIMRFLYGLNLKVGNYSDDSTATYDYLWSYMLDCGNEFYNTNKKTKIKFSDFYNYFVNNTLGTNIITVDEISKISTKCLMSPTNINTSKDSTGVNITWDIGKEDNNVSSNYKAYLVYYTDGSTYEKYELEFTHIKTSSNLIECSSKIPYSLIKTNDKGQLNVGLAFSPHYYDIKNNNSGYTGPYTTIFNIDYLN